MNYKIRELKMNRRPGSILLLIAAACLASSCVTHSTKVEDSFGDSVRNMVAEQTRYPNEVPDDVPADGMLGKEGDIIMDAYKRTLPQGEIRSELEAGL